MLHGICSTKKFGLGALLLVVLLAGMGLFAVTSATQAQQARAEGLSPQAAKSISDLSQAYVSGTVFEGDVPYVYMYDSENDYQLQPDVDFEIAGYTTADGEPHLNYLCSAYRSFFEHVAPYMDFMKNELLHQRPPANVMTQFPETETPTINL